MSVAVSDPIYKPRERLHFGERLAVRFINDRRDVPFLVLMGSSA